MVELIMLSDELKSVLINAIIPVIVTISIKLAIISKIGKLTGAIIIITFVTGVGAAYLFYGLVTNYLSSEWQPLGMASITFAGEKIGHYFVYKFNVDVILDALYKKLLNWIKK